MLVLLFIVAFVVLWVRGIKQLRASPTIDARQEPIFDNRFEHIARLTGPLALGAMSVERVASHTLENSSRPTTWPDDVHDPAYAVMAQNIYHQTPLNPEFTMLQAMDTHPGLEMSMHSTFNNTGFIDTGLGNTFDMNAPFHSSFDTSC